MASKESTNCKIYIWIYCISKVCTDTTTILYEYQSRDLFQVIQLPFNSGLSYGLNRALEKVETPYVMRMDDDELLTVKTCLGAQVKFLEMHPEVDLVGFCTLTAIRLQMSTTFLHC